jgi:hypothetical protein
MESLRQFQVTTIHALDTEAGVGLSDSSVLSTNKEVFRRWIALQEKLPSR